MGDINIDFLRPLPLFIRDCFSVFNLKNTILEATRVTADSNTLIDPVIVSESCMVLDSGVIPIDTSLSDHKATYISLRSTVKQTSSHYRYVLNYKNANFDRLNYLIDTFNWNDLYRESIYICRFRLYRIY